ncbi:MAG TPA: DNA-binding protein [Negativicutes bacterium]|jgi:DNA-binding PadR family transcriptional regulator
MKLPLRFRILHLLSHYSILSELEIMNNLRPEYGDEGQFKQSNFAIHLASMRAVGIIESTDPTIDSAGCLQQKYKITDYGMQRLSYLPKEWQQKSNINANL